MEMVPKGYLIDWSQVLSKIFTRLIEQEDCLDLLSWRNDPATREMSLASHVVSQEEHIMWFDVMLASKDQVGIIGELDGLKIGVVFFKNNAPGSLVSINLNPQFRGKTLSAGLLKKAIKKFIELPHEIRYLVAEIKESNKASIQIFGKNGFTLDNLENGIRSLRADIN